MRVSITTTYALTVLAVIAAVLASSLWATRLFFERDFKEYVFAAEREFLESFADNLAIEYMENDESWEFIKQNQQSWHRYGKLERSRFRRQQRETANEGESNDNRRLRKRGTPIVILDQDHNVILGRSRESEVAPADHHEIPIVANGVTVGYLQNQVLQQLGTDVDLAFSNSQKRSVLTVGVVSLVLGGLFAYLIARRFVSPIKRIKAHTLELQKGDYDRQLKLKRQDELGDLAASVDQLGAILQANKSARQRWLADVSHELRTPLTVVKGELEALNDQVRPLTPEALNSLSNEVDHLLYLVDDLNQLTLTDLGALAYHKTQHNLNEIISSVVKSMSVRLESAQMKVTFSKATEATIILGDEHRLKQLFTNLIDNSIKYTDKPGKLVISITASVSSYLVSVADSAPGLAASDLARIFEPMYQVDQARTGQGSGLGLAIARNLAIAHEATIEAQASVLGGVDIKLVFPKGRM